jgi:hypothetical protein
MFAALVGAQALVFSRLIVSTDELQLVARIKGVSGHPLGRESTGAAGASLLR